MPDLPFQVAPADFLCRGQARTPPMPLARTGNVPVAGGVRQAGSTFSQCEK